MKSLRSGRNEFAVLGDFSNIWKRGRVHMEVRTRAELEFSRIA